MEREISDTEIELFQILEKIYKQVEFIDGVNDDCYDDIGRQELIDFIKTNPDATTGIIILQGMTIGQKREKQCSKILVKRRTKSNMTKYCDKDYRWYEKSPYEILIKKIRFFLFH